MLVLTRCPDRDKEGIDESSIVIRPPGCDPITVVLCQVRANKAKIGIRANRDVKIIRAEIDKCEATAKTIFGDLPIGGEVEDDLDIAEQVAMNAGLCLAWNCKDSAGKSGYCERHK